MVYRFDLNTVIDEFYEQCPNVAASVDIIDTSDLSLKQRLKIARSHKQKMDEFFESYGADVPESWPDIALNRMLINNSPCVLAPLDVPIDTYKDVGKYPSFKTVFIADPSQTYQKILSNWLEMGKGCVEDKGNAYNDMMQQFIFDHEVGHALTLDPILKAGSDLHDLYSGCVASNYRETIADLYAILRAEQRSDMGQTLFQNVKDIRTASVLCSGDVSHYTSPHLDKIMPKIDWESIKDKAPEALAKYVVKLINQDFDPQVAADATRNALDNYNLTLGRQVVKINMNPLSMFNLRAHKKIKEFTRPKMIQILPGKRTPPEKRAQYVAKLARTTAEPLVYQICQDWLGATERLGIKITNKNEITQALTRNRRAWEAGRLLSDIGKKPGCVISKSGARYINTLAPRS